MPVSEDTNPDGVVPESADPAFAEKHFNDEVFVAPGAGPGVPVNAGALVDGLPKDFCITSYQLKLPIRFDTSRLTVKKL